MKEKRKKSLETQSHPEGIRDFSIQMTVFICGGALMSFEIIATRFLAPYFGNSVYVWGAVISLFLAAMTFGYTVGGKLSDRYPPGSLLSLVLVAAGGFVVITPSIADPVCGVFESWGSRSGTLAASLVLFAPASLLIASVSPIAIHACVKELGKVGLTSGRIYAVSAAGSILGTLGTSFFLIPILGVGGIALVLGFLLFLCAAQMRYFSTGWGGAGRFFAVMISIGSVSAVLFQASARNQPHRTIFMKETPYHNVSVVDVGKQRQLRFDNFVESGIELSPPYWSTTRYTDSFHLLGLVHPEPKSVAFIGAGGGVGPREFRMFYPSLLRIDVVDIDPVVLEVCREHFFLDEDQVTRLHAQDGRQFIKRSDRKWDAVILDAFTIGGQIPFHLATREYFQEISDHLTSNGVLIMNTNSSLAGRYSMVFQTVDPSLREVFKTVIVFALGPPAEVSRELPRNVVFLATNGEAPGSAGEWRALARGFDESHANGRKNLLGIVASLVSPEALEDLERGPILTDRFAPIDTYEFHPR